MNMRCMSCLHELPDFDHDVYRCAWTDPMGTQTYACACLIMLEHSTAAQPSLTAVPCALVSSSPPLVLALDCACPLLCCSFAEGRPLVFLQARRFYFPARSCSALPCPALPCAALPCPALHCPACLFCGLACRLSSAPENLSMLGAALQPCAALPHASPTALCPDAAAVRDVSQANNPSLLSVHRGSA